MVEHFQIFFFCPLYWRVEHTLRSNSIHTNPNWYWKGERIFTFEAYSTVLVSNNWTGHHQYGVVLNTAQTFVSQSTIRNGRTQYLKHYVHFHTSNSNEQWNVARIVLPKYFDIQNSMYIQESNRIESNYQQIREQRKLNSNDKDSSCTIAAFKFNNWCSLYDFLCWIISA